MSERTVSSTHDARDAEGRRLLEAGEHAALRRSYDETIIQRCRARTRREDDALECAQRSPCGSSPSSSSARATPSPIAWSSTRVIEWTTKGFYERGPAVLVELGDDILADGDPVADVDARYDLERALTDLAEGDGEVAQLRYLDGLEIEEIANRLGKTRNAVDQSLFRSRRKLQELLT